ncbi:phosphoenolpyruvate--protein phosphotransferase [Siculibacillus lacustris]|uniref:Phosphoenolpyruvate-protein phosphotransferase n=1 Tax=Siculibacillus lacustris TaxID=1549641 RepID=A0A4Q9VMZ7_9HYPH|nr:putative PEP-binding protein [Siculibacillus lacustris]TBW36755.1 phosphoenolpyruvate--protein phosphotransferase [Siculibacillus lacustris]
MAEIVSACGRAASPGLVTGPLVRLADRAEARRASPRVARGDAAAETARLDAAIGAAGEGLDAAIAGVGDDVAAEVLGFQRELLDDDDLIDSVRAAIADGSAAGDAWGRVMDEQIADFAASDDEVFRARTADLADLRDRVAGHLSGRSGEGEVLPDHAVVHAVDLAPSRFLAIDWNRCGGIALAEGSATSHVAMLARSRGVPMAIGLGPVAFPDGALVTLDGETGRLSEAAADAVPGRQASAGTPDEPIAPGPATTADGERVVTLINIMGPSDLERPEAAHADGIGLLRSEFLFAEGRPDEEAQVRIYRDILAWAAGRPVTVRTLDVGGDKPLEGVTIEGEANPFLGLRGIRLSLKHRDLFLTQLRALARAAVDGDLEVMFPMIAVPAEYDAAAALMDEALAALAREGIPARRPRLGMMVEVPSAAIAIDLFAAEFFSIGSNDLTQFVLACDRANGAVNDLFDATNPAVVRLISQVVAHGRATGRKVSLCGELASDPHGVRILLDAGLDRVSVSLAALGRTRRAIAGYRRGDV